MTDLELTALVALVNADTAHLNQQMTQYGEQQCEFPVTARLAIEAELLRRGVLPVDEHAAAELCNDEAKAQETAAHD